jgi:hypothetical protein
MDEWFATVMARAKEIEKQRNDDENAIEGLKEIFGEAVTQGLKFAPNANTATISYKGKQVCKVEAVDGKFWLSWSPMQSINEDGEPMRGPAMQESTKDKGQMLDRMATLVAEAVAAEERANRIAKAAKA